MKWCREGGGQGSTMRWLKPQEARLSWWKDRVIQAIADWAKGQSAFRVLTHSSAGWAATDSVTTNMDLGSVQGLLWTCSSSPKQTNMCTDVCSVWCMFMSKKRVTVVQKTSWKSDKVLKRNSACHHLLQFLNNNKKRVQKCSTAEQTRNSSSVKWFRLAEACNVLLG